MMLECRDELGGGGRLNPCLSIILDSSASAGTIVIMIVGIFCFRFC